MYFYYRIARNKNAVIFKKEYLRVGAVLRLVFVKRVVADLGKYVAGFSYGYPHRFTAKQFFGKFRAVLRAG